MTKTFIRPGWTVAILFVASVTMSAFRQQSVPCLSAPGVVMSGCTDVLNERDMLVRVDATAAVWAVPFKSSGFCNAIKDFGTSWINGGLDGAFSPPATWQGAQINAISNFNSSGWNWGWVNGDRLRAGISDANWLGGIALHEGAHMACAYSSGGHECDSGEGGIGTAIGDCIDYTGS